MSVCVIYGPVASGKFTTAAEFANQTGYKLFHNHLVQNLLVDLFPYEQIEYRERRILLSRRIRKDIYRSIFEAGIDVVTTMNFGGQGGLDLMRFLVQTAKDCDQPIYLVHLVPEREELDRRVVNVSRQNMRKAHTIEKLDELLSGEGYGYETFPDVEHLQIDNTQLPAEETAKKIIEHYAIASGEARS